MYSSECHFYAILHKTDWLDFILNFRFTRNALEFIWSFNFSQLHFKDFQLWYILDILIHVLEIYAANNYCVTIVLRSDSGLESINSTLNFVQELSISISQWDTYFLTYLNDSFLHWPLFKIFHLLSQHASLDTSMESFSGFKSLHLNVLYTYSAFIHP